MNLMSLTPIETLATIFAVLILLKMLFLVFKPNAWMKFTEKLLKDTKVLLVIYLILALIVAKYIFAVFNIVQVAAVMLFTALLYGVAFLPHSTAMLKIGKSMLRGQHLEKNWISIVIWAALAIWVLKTLFF